MSALISVTTGWQERLLLWSNTHLNLIEFKYIEKNHINKTCLFNKTKETFFPDLHTEYYQDSQAGMCESSVSN